MEKREKHGSKNDSLTREYLHSISRIGDRLKGLQRDIKRQKEELAYMEEDVTLLSEAFDSLFNDLMKRLGKKFCTDDEHNVEEV